MVVFGRFASKMEKLEYRRKIREQQMLPISISEFVKKGQNIELDIVTYRINKAWKCTSLRSRNCFTVLHTKFYDYDSQEFVKGMDEIGSS